MPHRVSLIEVIALTENVERNGSIELSDLARYFSRYSSPHLLSILSAAQLLGLVQRDGGLVNITDLGVGFARASAGKEGIIRATLVKIEPFKTTLELLSRRRAARAKEVATELVKKGGTISSSQTVEDSVRTALIEWGISSGLFSYDGSKFRLA
jgi:hypothetical protein